MKYDIRKPAGYILGLSLMFNVQSIDTMKDSRDLARTMIGDDKYGQFISQELSMIKNAGANYVAIGTPYDREFWPLIERWVGAARENGLKVWFRGNMSGWEGWFGYAPIGEEDHLKGAENFILGNPDLFRDGDIFTACPECENGGTGDPRQNGDVESYRDFLINEYRVHGKAFDRIGRKVFLLNSMNADVARLVMDKETTRALGGIVVIDDYRSDPKLIGRDIEEIAELSGGHIILGEFGAPIPDINGEMTDNEQAKFVGDVLFELFKHDDKVVGANYWTARLGSTALLRDDLSPKPVYSVVQDFYSADLTKLFSLYLRGLLSNI